VSEDEDLAGSGGEPDGNVSLGLDGGEEESEWESAVEAPERERVTVPNPYARVYRTTGADRAARAEARSNKN